MNCVNESYCEMRCSIDGPSWRSILAKELASSPKSMWKEVSDELVHQMAGFYQSLNFDRNDGRDAAKQFPVIAAAKSLWENPEIRRQFVILTLGDCERGLIGKRLNIDLSILKTMEALFFDVRGSRNSKGWINAHVILPESKSGCYDLATKYRAAYWGGPLVALDILDAGHGNHLEEAKRIADQELLLQLKLLEALEFRLCDERSAVHLVKILCDHDHRTKRLEFTKEQFRSRCEESIRKHELAVRRLDAMVDRDRERAELKRQRADIQAREVQEKADLAARYDRDRVIAEQRAAKERALNSPLAQLSWSDGANSQDTTPRADTEVVHTPKTFNDSTTEELAPAAA